MLSDSSLAARLGRHFCVCADHTLRGYGSGRQPRAAGAPAGMRRRAPATRTRRTCAHYAEQGISGSCGFDAVKGLDPRGASTTRAPRRRPADSPLCTLCALRVDSHRIVRHPTAAFLWKHNRCHIGSEQKLLGCMSRRCVLKSKAQATCASIISSSHATAHAPRRHSTADSLGHPSLLQCTHSRDVPDRGLPQ